MYEFRALQRKEKRSRPRIVGVLGCMAERLKEKLLEKDKLVDVVVGPDAYRDLPRLLARAEDGDTAINTLLSLDETYADVAPVRTADNRVSAYVSIMRGWYDAPPYRIMHANAAAAATTCVRTASCRGPAAANGADTLKGNPHWHTHTHTAFVSGTDTKPQQHSR